MRYKNRMSPLYYITEHLYAMCLAVISYELIFFAPLPEMSAKISRIFLWTFTVGLGLWGCLLNIEKNRNYRSLIVNVLIPLEIYTVFVYWNALKGQILGVILFSAAVSVFFWILVIIPDSHVPPQRIPPLKYRIRRGFFKARSVAAVCMLVLMLPLGTRLFINHGLYTAEPPTVSCTSAEEWSAEAHTDILRTLTGEEWLTLEPQEKLDLLGVILELEMEYLGIPQTPQLLSEVLENSTLAHYNHAENEIVIDIGHLKDDPAVEVLDSLCHEGYHCYQHWLIELYRYTPTELREMYLFQETKKYIVNFNDYINTAEDPVRYYEQIVEVSARTYAAEAVERYYGMVGLNISTGGEN